MPTLFQQLRTLRESRIEQYPWGPHGPYIAPPWAAARLGKRVFASKAEYRKLVLKDYKPFGRHHPAAVAARIATREATAAMDVDSWNEGDSYSLIDDQHLRCLKRRTCGDVDLRMGHAIRRCVRTSEEEIEILSDIAAFMSFRSLDDDREETHSATYSQTSVDCDIVAVKDEPTEGVIPALVSGAEGHLFIKQEDEQQLLWSTQSSAYIHEQSFVEDVVVTLDTPATMESQFVQEVLREATHQIILSDVKVEPSPSVEITYALKETVVEPVLATPRDEVTMSMSVDLIPPTACAWADEFVGAEHQVAVVGPSSRPQVKLEQEDVNIPPAIVAAAQALGHTQLCVRSDHSDLFLPPLLIEEDVDMAQPQAPADVAPCLDVKEEEPDNIYFDDLLLAVALRGGSIQPSASLPTDLLLTAPVSPAEEDINMEVPVALQEPTLVVASVEPTLPVAYDALAAPLEFCIKAEPEDDAANFLGASEVPSGALLVKEEPVECAVPCLPSVAELPPQPEEEPASTVIQLKNDLAPVPFSPQEHISSEPFQGDLDFTSSLRLEEDSTLVCGQLHEAAVPEDETPIPSEVAVPFSASDALEDSVASDGPGELSLSEEDPIDHGTTEIQVTITDPDAPACSPSLHSIHQPRDVDLEDEDAVRVCEESEPNEYSQVDLECPTVTEEDSPVNVNVSVEEDVETCLAEDELPSMGPVHSCFEISGLETAVTEDDSRMPGGWIPVPEGHAPESGAYTLSYRRLGSVVVGWSRRLVKTLADVGHAIILEDSAPTEPFPAMVGADPSDTSEVLASGTEEPSPALTLSSSVVAVLEEFACAPPPPSWRDGIEASLLPLSSPPSVECLACEQPSEQPQPGSPEFASNFAQASFPGFMCGPPLLSMPTRASLDAIVEHHLGAESEVPSDAQDEALTAPLLQPNACMQSLGFIQCATPFVTALDFFDNPNVLAPESQYEEECPSDSDMTCVSSERDKDIVHKVIDEPGVQQSPATHRCDVQESVIRDVHQPHAAHPLRITFEDVWESARSQLYTEEAIAERATQRAAQRQSQIAQAFVDKVIADIRRERVPEPEPEPQHVSEQLDPMQEYMLSVEGIYGEVDDLLELYAPPEKPSRSARTLFDEAPELAVAEEDSESEEYWRTRATIDMSAPGPFSDRLVKEARESFWRNWTRPSVEDLAAVFKPSEAPLPGPIISLKPIKNAPVAPAPEPSPVDHYRESLVNAARDQFWWYWSCPSDADLAAEFVPRDEGYVPAPIIPIVYNFSPVKPLRIVKKNKAPAPSN
ncbi:hypothetical protein C8Q73DRAFT_149816 [Cubamyces lactineus]|nr:hypothetical protein C8Q73DRAFT_149816 [Cubamyces lactineus]